MRKVFVVLVGLILGAFIFSCSEDSTTTTPPAPQPEFGIATAELPVGYTCSPYIANLEAANGAEPYVWTLADGSDPLPTGLSLTVDGRIIGLLEATGEYTITLQVADDSATPKTATQEFTITIATPQNPSFAVFFDELAEDCSAATQAFITLDCYVFIMLQDCDLGCAQAAEFQLRLTDADGIDLEDGTHFGILSTKMADNIVVNFGTPFSGLAVAYDRPMFGIEPIPVCTFKLLLMEDLNQLTFNFGPNPGGHLGVATCEINNPVVDIDGRTAALNF